MTWNDSKHPDPEGDTFGAIEDVRRVSTSNRRPSSWSAETNGPLGDENYQNNGVNREEQERTQREKREQDEQRRIQDELARAWARVSEVSDEVMRGAHIQLTNR